MVGASREVGDGVAIDGSVQYITERPELEDQADDVVYATDPQPAGEETVEDVPQPPSDADDRRPDVEGQSTIDDWRWSA